MVSTMPTMQRVFLISVAALAPSACDGGGGGAGITHDIEDRVTITTGVFGQLIGGCDTTDCEERYLTGTAVGASSGGSAVAVDVADGVGFYELALAAGDYELNAGDGTSTATFAPWSATETVTVTDGAATRHDFESGPGGGFWH